MKLSRFAQQRDGSVLAEMLMAGLVFLLLAAIVTDYAIRKKTAPVAVLQTEPQPPRLILIE
ncbi:MAG: hypothetical protein QNI90_05300 [Dinoroseobacter sp.]|nr:hypothetical protein [Dinoroseobacter sp.]MDJ0992968.1 hypothetical protein [Dinoroseobacter sp.]